MAVVQCKRKHFYDNSKYQECPHCVLADQTEILSDADILESQRSGNYAAAYIRQNMAQRCVDDAKKDVKEKARQEMDASYFEDVTYRLPIGQPFPVQNDFEEMTQALRVDHTVTEMVQEMALAGLETETEMLLAEMEMVQETALAEMEMVQETALAEMVTEMGQRSADAEDEPEIKQESAAMKDKLEKPAEKKEALRDEAIDKKPNEPL